MYIDLEGKIETIRIRLDPDSAKLLKNLFGSLSLNDIKKLMGKSFNKEEATEVSSLTNELYKELRDAFDTIKEIDVEG